MSKVDQKIQPRPTQPRRKKPHSWHHYLTLFFLGWFTGGMTWILILSPALTHSQSWLYRTWEILNHIPLIGIVVPNPPQLQVAPTPVYIPSVVSPAFVNSYYGYRLDPLSQTQTFHNGLDFDCALGQLILAVGDGVVQFAGSQPLDAIQAAYGNFIVIDQGHGNQSVYGHNSELLVHPGQHVIQGEAIARCGSTGRSSAPHSHLEFRQQGATLDPFGLPTVDPLPLLKVGSYQVNPLASPQLLGGIRK